MLQCMVYVWMDGSSSCARLLQFGNSGQVSNTHLYIVTNLNEFANIMRHVYATYNMF